MLNLSTRYQFLVGTILALLMIVTRGHHFANVNHLPGASGAAFFLAGVYLRPVVVLAVFFTLTWIVDYVAIAYGGVGSFCFTPAYGFLLPGYGSLWLAGRWYAARHRLAWPGLLRLVGAVLVGALLCELFSSGGFYFFSDRFAATSASGFASRLLQFFPAFLQSALFYVGGAALAHGLIAAGRKPRNSSGVLNA